MTRQRSIWALALMAVVGAFAVACDAPRPQGPLTQTQFNRVNEMLRERQLTQPNDIEINSNGFVEATYVVSKDERARLAVSMREYGESRLLAIREALLPDGFHDYRVNV